MKKLLIPIFSVFALLSCSDEGVSPSNKTVALKNENQASQLDIGPVNPFVWTKLTVPQMSSYPFNGPNGSNLIIPVGNDVYCLIAGAYEVVYKLNTHTKLWEPFSDPYQMYLPFAVGHQYLFSYQSKFYYGFRSDAGDEDYVTSLDPVTGQRGNVPRFPGIPVSGPACFSLGTKGYIVGGRSNASGNVVNQFWEIDFITNQWTDRGTVPGGARADALAFMINNKVYYGLGYDYINFNGQKIKRLKDDWYSFDPTVSGGFAAVKADFPGTNRNQPKGFTINNKVYFGWGWTGQPGDLSYLTDFWEYNPDTNTWTQKPSCPATTVDFDNVNVFAYGNAGYLVKGWLAQYWRYSSSSFVPTN